MKKFKSWLEDLWFTRYIVSAIIHPKNFFFCLKYPFWKSYNVWTGRFMGYASTWYDTIPEGWRKAFGKELTMEIAAALKKEHFFKCTWHKYLQWEQIKEKYGTLRLYCMTTDSVEYVLNKYELLSQCYCINCGEPVRYITSGWVYYLCHSCFLSEYIRQELSAAEIKKISNQHKVKLADIPEITHYKNGKETKINIKEKYGIDFIKLWGLEDEFKKQSKKTKSKK